MQRHEDEDDSEEEDEGDEDESSEEEEDDDPKGGYSIRTHSGGGKQLRQLSGAPGGGKMLRVPDANANESDDDEESDEEDDDNEGDDDDDDEESGNHQRSTVVAAAPRVGGGKQLRMPGGGGKQLRMPGGGGKQLRPPPSANENGNNEEESSDDDDDDEDESSEEEAAVPPRPSGGGKSLANMARGGGKQLRPPPAPEEDDDEEEDDESSSEEEDDDEKESAPPVSRPMGGGKSLGNMGYARGGGKQLRPPSPEEDEKEDDEDESSDDEEEETPVPQRPFGGGKALGNMGGAQRGSGKQLRPPSQTKDDDDDDDEDEEEEESSSSSEEDGDDAGDEATRIVQRPAGGKMLRPPPAPSMKEETQANKTSVAPSEVPTQPLLPSAAHASSESDEDSGDESDDQKVDSKGEAMKGNEMDVAKDSAKPGLGGSDSVPETSSKPDKDDVDEMNVSDGSSSSSDQEEDDVAVKPWAKKESAVSEKALPSDFSKEAEPSKKEVETETKTSKAPVATNDDFEAEAELSSDDENGEFEEMDVDNMDPRDLVKDEEDQKYLDSLPEFEREAVLGERFEKLKNERDMKKALREAKQRERDRQSATASGKKTMSATKSVATPAAKTKITDANGVTLAGKVSDSVIETSDTLAEKKEQEKGNSALVDSVNEKPGSDRKTAGEADDMIIDEEKKVVADSDAKRSTERLVEKRDDEDSDDDAAEKEAEKDDDEEDIDYGSSEDDSDDSEADVSKPWSKGTGDSSSKTRKTLSANNRIGGKLSDMRDSGDESSGSEGRPGSGKVAVEASTEDFKTICLPRRRLARWCNEPWFEQAVVGCYVRLGLGVDEKTKKFVYRFCRVVGVTETNHTYTFPKKPNEKTAVVSAKQLTLEFGNNQRNFRMLKISDSPPTELEVMKYVTQVKNSRNKILSRSMARKIKRDQSQLIDNYKYTKDDIEKAIEEKKKLKLVADNVAKEKTRIEIEVQAAKEALAEAEANLKAIMVDSERQDEVAKAQDALEAAQKVLDAKTEARIKILEVDARQKQRSMNSRKIQNWAKVNHRAKQKNRKADYLSYRDQRVHGKGDNGSFNPYARRNNKPEMLWEVGQRREKDSEGGKVVDNDKTSEKSTPAVLKQEAPPSEDSKRRKQKQMDSSRKKILGMKHQISLGGHSRQNGEIIAKKRIRRGISLKDYQERKAAGTL